MRISWITKEKNSPAVVEYGTSPGVYGFSADGSTNSYSYALYNSGEIHDVVIGPLTPESVYYYRCSSASAHEFSFKMPPTQFPVKFVVVGKPSRAKPYFFFRTHSLFSKIHLSSNYHEDIFKYIYIYERGMLMGDLMVLFN